MQLQVKISIIDLQVLQWGTAAASGDADAYAQFSLYLRLKRADIVGWRLSSLHSFPQGQDG